ncbi:MAG TPA: preprotein translocase subunit SecG [Gemmataceae bacterium]|nr:preprotein translocase subunit SecG [Gemmataceae bacterium]
MVFAKLGIWTWVPDVLRPILLLLGIFLILLVLIQRGKGGGLAGAFGGVGGSSAFGSRAGDLFTRITIITAGIWILLLMFQVYAVQTVAEKEKAEGSLTAPANSGQ